MAGKAASINEQKNDFMLGKLNNPKDTGANVFMEAQQIDPQASVFVNGIPLTEEELARTNAGHFLQGLPTEEELDKYDSSSKVFYGGVQLHPSAIDFLK